MRVSGYRMALRDAYASHSEMSLYYRRKIVNVETLPRSTIADAVTKLRRMAEIATQKALKHVESSDA